MRCQAGSVLALLACSASAQGARRHYRRQDSPSNYNGTLVSQQLPSSSSASENATSFTFTYAFVPESQASSTPTPSAVSVISTYVVVSTYSQTSTAKANATEPAPSNSTVPVLASPSPTNIPYPISGSPGQSYYSAGNATFPTGRGSSASQSRGSASPSRHPKVQNGTCGGATLNVQSAHVDYWYTETYTHIASTVSIQFNANDSQTGWSILPETTTFDVSTAISQHTCGQSTVYSTGFNLSTTSWDCWTTPTPVASSTAVLSVDAFKSTNQTTGNGTNIPNLATEPPPAVTTLPSAAGTFTAGTPFVYFSQFEIESARPTTHPDGSEECVTATQAFLLNRLFSFEFPGDEAELSQQRLASTEDTTGEIDPAFLRLLNNPESITPGSWTAEPTVIVVVERSVVAQAVLAAGGAARQGPLITPTPTLPSFLTPAKPTAPPSADETTYSPYIEKPADSLDVPSTFVKPVTFFRGKTFIAHMEQSATTLVLPVATDTDVITTNVDGRTLVATALKNEADGSGGGGGMNAQQGGGSGGNGQNGNSNGGGDDRGFVVVPFITRVENSDITLDVPAPATQKVATVAFQGQTLTATALNAVETGNGGSNGGSGNGGSNNGGSNNGGSSNGGSNNGGSNNGGSNNGGSNNGGSNNGGFSNGGSSNGGSNNGGSNNGGGQNAGSGSNSGGGGDGQGGNGNSGSGNGNGNSGQGNNGNGNSGNNGNNGGGGVFGNLVSAIANAAKPTNAAQVLSQALNQGHKDATAAAIAAGLGGIAAGAGAEAGENGYGSNGGGSGSGNGGSGSGSGFGSGSGSGSQGGFGSGSDAQAQQLGASPGQVITAGGATATAQAGSAFAIDGQTVVPGGPPITVDGTVISAPASTNAIVVDGTTIPVGGSFASASDFMVNGMAITAQPGVFFPIAGQTLQAGGPAITVDGTRLSLAPGGTALVIGSSTSEIAAAGAGGASDIPELTFGGQTFTANAATQFFLAPGQTLTPGGTAVVSGTTISLASDASAIVINGQTQALDSSPSAAITAAPAPITINGQAFFPNAGGTYLISGQTLTPGGRITLMGPNGAETLSLAPSGSSLLAIVSGQTLTSPLGAAADATAAPVLTIGGDTFTALPGTDGADPTYVINGKTLTAGEEETVTVNGRTYVASLAPEATLLEVEELGPDGKPTRTGTQTLFPATATGTVTMSGSGSRSSGDAASGTSPDAPAAETGAAASLSVQALSLGAAVAGSLAFAVLL